MCRTLSVLAPLAVAFAAILARPDAAVARDAPFPTPPMSRCRQNSAPDRSATPSPGGGRGTRLPDDGARIVQIDDVTVLSR